MSPDTANNGRWVWSVWLFLLDNSLSSLSKYNWKFLDLNGLELLMKKFYSLENWKLCLLDEQCVFQMYHFCIGKCGHSTDLSDSYKSIWRYVCKTLFQEPTSFPTHCYHFPLLSYHTPVISCPDDYFWTQQSSVRRGKILGSGKSWWNLARWKSTVYL